MAAKSIFIIILNWNHKDDLKLTIDSFVNQDYSLKRIIVADNGSDDGSIEFVRTIYPNVILIENKENLGYAAGNNRAIEYALSQNAEYILLANNDIYIDNQNLLSEIIADISVPGMENLGIYGIQERNYFDKKKIESEGYILFADIQRKNKPFNNRRIETNIESSSSKDIVDFISGSFILINKNVITACGLLDEAFFMYHEEAEFCYRAWLNNFYVMVNSSLYYYHKVAQSSGIRSPLSVYYRVRNNYYFLFKHKKDIKFFRCFLLDLMMANIIGFLKLSISLFLTSSSNYSIWKAHFFAFRDILKKRYYKADFPI